MDLQTYWQAVLRQQPHKIKAFFHKDAYVNWHNTNERFTVDEFINVNCVYPGTWHGVIERIVEKDDLIITVVRVFSTDEKKSFHVTSFIKVKDEKIILIDEYWSDDGDVPEWRRNMHIGTTINEYDII